MFFIQKRIGKDGIPFKMYKFRTMIINADSVLEELLENPIYKEEWDINQKIEDDPRITKAGILLRKNSFDEIPQLINVLKGDMSLIGPRPLVSGELEGHDGLDIYRIIKPGLTGWWGSNGRSNVEYEKRLELEYFYIFNYSFKLDIVCIIGTIVSVLRKEGI